MTLQEMGNCFGEALFLDQSDAPAVMPRNSEAEANRSE